MATDIPQGWESIRLAELTNVVSARNVGGEDIPVLSMTKHNGFVDSLKYFKKQVFSKDTANYKVVRRGQFAYATIHLDEGSIDLLDKYDAGLISPMYTVFEPNRDKVDQQFLRTLLKSEWMINRYGQLGQGSINRRKSIGFKVFGTLSILLPPLPEQKKITAILSSVDEAIQATQAVIDQTRKVKQGMLQQLLTRGIGHTRFKQTEIGEIPEGWEVVTLGEMTEESAFGPRFPAGLYDSNGRYWTLRTTDVSKSWEINYDTIPRANLSEDSFEKHRLHEGDLLITRSGTCGHVCVYHDQQYPVPVIPGAFLIRFRLKEKVLPDFVRLAMMAASAQTRVQMMTAGGVQKNLSGTNFKTLPLPLPPVQEQKEIVEKVSEVDTAEKKSTASLEVMSNLKSGIMQDLLTGRVRIGEVQGIKAAV